MPYAYSCRALQKIIWSVAPAAEASDAHVDDHGMTCNFNYCLWMLEQIEKAPRSTDLTSAAKWGRWLGYVFGRLEYAGLLTNQDSRDIARVGNQRGDV
jgi:hypothetical protein